MKKILLAVPLTILSLVLYANEALIERINTLGLDPEVAILKVDTKSILYTKSGGLYSTIFTDHVPEKVNHLPEGTMEEYYLVDDGVVYLRENNYKGFSFEGVHSMVLNVTSLGIINEGATYPPLVDSDNDGVYNHEDNCPYVANSKQTDIDGDGIGNRCDIDKDGDNYSDALELEHGTNRFKASEYPQGVEPDLGQPTLDPEEPITLPPLEDADEDGVLNGVDNCPTIHNPTQWDNNENGIGNRCDPDIDGDGFSNEVEIAAKSDPWTEDSTPDNINGYVPPVECDKGV